MNGWQPIETANKGGGAELVTDPAWVEPPRLLLAFAGGDIDIGYWDWFYAEGGSGYHLSGGQAWCDRGTGEPFENAPSHWMPLPDPPADCA